MIIEHFIMSGGVVVAIIAVMMIEALLLISHARRFPGILMGLAAGACLALALGAALQQRSWHSIAVCLILALVFHVLEIRQWLLLAKQSRQ